LTTQGQQTATQTASSDFLLNTVNELSEQEQVIFWADQNDSQASTTGTNFSGKNVLPVNSFSPIGIPESDPHHCALVNAPFMIAIFVSTVPNTLQPILKPLNKIGTFIFQSR